MVDKQNIIEKIKQLSMSDINSYHADNILNSIISFINQNSIDNVNSTFDTYLVKLDELCQLNSLDGLSVSIHFDDLKINKDDLFVSIVNYISSEVINMNDNPSRNRKYDQNSLILDLYSFIEEVLVLIESDNN